LEVILHQKGCADGWGHNTFRFSQELVHGPAVKFKYLSSPFSKDVHSKASGYDLLKVFTFRYLCNPLRYPEYLLMVYVLRYFKDLLWLEQVKVRAEDPCDPQHAVLKGSARTIRRAAGVVLLPDV